MAIAAPALALNNFPGTTITGASGGFSGTTVGSNGETGEPVPPAGGTMNSMWYSWTAPASGTFNFGTCNTTVNTASNYDTDIGFYTGNAVNALTTIGGVDDTANCNTSAGAGGGPGLGSVLSFPVTSGVTYRLQIDGFAANVGAFQVYYGLTSLVVATTDGSATEGGDTGAFTVALSTVPSANVTVTVGTSAQCTFAAAALTFTPTNWNVPQTVTATATNDVIVEGVHSCAPATLTAANGGFAGVTATPPTITVNDNDSATVTIANTTNGAEPAANGLMTVTQTAVSSVNTVIAYSVGGTATSGSDFTALAGTVTILAGATTATIPIPVLNDSIVEPGETVIVTLTSVTSGLATLGATLIATSTITSDDTATVSIANTTNASEPATNGVLTVTQTNPSATNTVIAYSVAGTATSGTDYSALSGTVTILAGATTATISIPVLDDPVVEGGETVIITLTSVTSGLATLGAPLVATNTITDNDSATVTIANTTDGAEAGPVNGVMTVTQSSLSATNTVISYTVGGTAASGADFTALSGTVTILAGATTATISIPVLNDLIVEGSETVVVTLTAVTSGLATLGATLIATNTIADNDTGTIVIVNTDNAATEAAGNTGAFTVALGLQPSVTVTVTIGASAQCAYAPTTLTFTTANWNVAQTVTVTPNDDAIVEGPHTCSPASVSAAGGAYAGVTAAPPVTNITDNDTAAVSIANTTNAAEPATNGVMTVTQTAVSATNTVIAYTVTGTAASGADFTALSGTVTIPAGATTATISIPVLDDAIVEGGETVTVTLTSVTSGLATLGATLIATNTIADNDTATVTIANTTNAAEPATNGVMTLTQTAVSSQDTVISYLVSGTAVSGSDYTALSGTVTILAGATTATISIPVLNDLVVEPSETLTVTLSAVTSGLATLGATVIATNNIADNDSATVTIANTTNAAEPATNGLMTLTQTAVASQNTVISYTVGGTAASGSDYTALSGTVTILAGATTATISIPVLDDAIVEGGETVVVTVTSVTSGLATLGATVIATNNIADNDNATVTIANTTNAAEPATNGVMTLTQTAVSSQDTVISYLVSGTAISGSDYTALSGTVTILAGSTTATISIPVLNDLVVEPTETLTVTLSAVTSGLATLGATLIATNNIADDDGATVTIANTTNAAEPSTNGLMTLTQTAVASQNTVISYTVGGTAASGSDYTALSGTVTILAGATAATISIPVLDDAIVEGGETVTVTLTSVTSGLATLGATLIATNNIADNDSATVTIANTTNAAEPGTNGVMTLTQTAVASQDTVISYLVSGTAVSGSDYTALSGTVTILAGATTATISIPVLNDLVVEPNETLTVTLSAVTSGLATLGATLVATNNIADNDSATVTIANTTNAAEPATNGLMTLTQTAVASQNTVIAYTVSGTAATGVDYTALSGTVTIPAGATTATISIPVLDDAIVEGGETVTVTLTSVTSGLATLGATLIATNTIADNDSATVAIANTANAAEPATNGLMTLTQTAVSSQDTVISYLVSGTAISGSDYTALSGTVTILAGATAATIFIPVLNDLVVEPNETLTVTLSAVTSGLATLGATLIATNNIADNDSATVTIANTTNAAEPSTNGLMTLTQTAVASQDTVISYTVGGTAASGSDYTALSGTVTIPAGATAAAISIPVLDDLIVDPGETVVVTLTSVTSGLATLGAALLATNTLGDNDVASFTIAKSVSAANIASPVTLTYTITVDNTGNVPLTGLAMTDTLLQGGSPRTLTSGPSYASGDTNTDNVLDASETWIYDAAYAVPQSDIDNGTAFSNTADFDTAETAALTSNAVATSITQTPSIDVSKSANVASVNFPGDPIIYSVLVTNNGNVTATGMTVTDTLAALACPTSGNNTIASLAPAAAETCTVTYPAAQAHFDTNGGGDGDIDNTAGASGTAAGSPVSDSGSVAVTLTPAPVLTIDKTADTAGPLTAGQVVNYTYLVTNTGNVTISGVDVNEIAFNGNGTPVPNPAAGGPTTLAPGGTVTFTASYTVTQTDIDQLQ